MKGKVTFKDVYKIFCSKFPNLSKEVIHWHPLGFGTIKLYLGDGRRMSYDITTNKIEPLRRWS